MSPLLVDIHTHLYPPSYISLLSSRTSVPYIHASPARSGSEQAPPPRLIILPSDDSESLPPAQRGRPIDASYSSISEKLAFMRHHHISSSVVSLANPWLDFLPPSTAAQTAREINDDMHALCAAHPGKLYLFGTLPLSAPLPAIVAEIHRLETLTLCKGIILGTTGLGAGLDDPALDPVYKAAESTGTLLFIHPHYGLPGEVFGPRAHESGHVLPLALGFPLETTIAFTRMHLAGIFDRFPALKILLAHAGGAVPFLAGRIDSCEKHERTGAQGTRTSIFEVLRRNVWVDGVVYHKVGVEAAVGVVGRGRVLWGSDHPFFPPTGEREGKGEEHGGKEEGEGKGGEEKQWLSVTLNVDAVMEAFGDDREGAAGVLGGNAVELFGLDVMEG
ncbi:hypothetical protein MMC30_008063 [Trapelia coarctata]|nr:hypothetical protein [Trapelia coarctata]